MPVTSIVASQLAAVASAIRVDRGLSTWDVAGVTSKIRDIAHLELPDVAMAVIRAAADPDARTPGVIPRMDAPHWRERITDPDKPTRPSRDDVCRSCGGHRLNLRLHPTDHGFVHLDAPRTDAELDAAVRAELAETIRYAGRTPDPEETQNP